MRYLPIVVGGIVMAFLTGSASAAPAGLRGFQMPSRNIVCGAYTGSTPASLRCDISSGLKPKPSRPKGCMFDYAGTLTLSATGRARIGCISDVVLPDPTKAPVLAYGKTWKYGPFKCRSARAGLTCRNRVGHGFFLNRQGWKRL